MLKPSVFASVLTCLFSACGGSTATTHVRTEPPVDHCVIALRFEAQEPVDDGSNPALAFPSTDLSLVRICDLAGRVVTSLGRTEGVCQYQTPALTDWVAADCGWPGRPTTHIVVGRDHGDAVATLNTEGSGASSSGRVALPEGADVRALAPGNSTRR
jgi:hypothetical protein